MPGSFWLVSATYPRAVSTDASLHGADGTRRRADAERNIEIILDAALDTILSGGEINMAAVARAAGLSRVTVYTHFPTREALVEGAVRRALDRLTATFAELALDEDPPDVALSQLLRSSWRTLARYRTLYAVASTVLSGARLRALHDPVFGRVDKLIERGQDVGAFRTDLPRKWLVATVYALLHLAAEEVNARRLPVKQVGDVLPVTVLSALTHRSGV